MATARIQLVTPSDSTSADPVRSIKKWAVEDSNRNAEKKKPGVRKGPRLIVLSRQECINSVRPYDDQKAAITVDESAENLAKFNALVTQWRNERGAQSSITEVAMMPAYQKIIGMGSLAITLLLSQLKSEGDNPDQWFWALRAITGENPVKPEDQGNFRNMAKAWLQWGQEKLHGYPR